jgi:hypothetical protein
VRIGLLALERAVVLSAEYEIAIAAVVSSLARKQDHKQLKTFPLFYYGRLVKAYCFPRRKSGCL